MPAEAFQAQLSCTTVKQMFAIGQTSSAHIRTKLTVSSRQAARI